MDDKIKPLTAAQIAEFTGGKLLGNGETVCTGVSTDSRAITKGCLYLPIKGERFDGHDFISVALETGAAAVVSQAETGNLPVPVIKVADTRQALLQLAAGYRSLLPLRAVGVTGSVGKTTTKEMIASVLSQKYKTEKTEGNLNNEIGLPLTLLRLHEGTQAAVLEMGMNHFGEISRMTAAAKPDIAVITNIGTSHIEFLGSREGILKAKLEILEGLRPGGTAVLAGDEPLLMQAAEKLSCHIITYGIENHNATLVGRDILCTEGGTRFLVENKGPSFPLLAAGKTFEVQIQALGEHNVLNALAAAAVGLESGLDTAQIAQGLLGYKPGGMRQNLYQRAGYVIFEDCYNASPDSVEAALKVLKSLPVKGKRFAALGAMRELGHYIQEGHRRCGRKAAECCDALYLYGEGAEYYKQGALERGMMEGAVKVYQTHEQLAKALKADASPGDAILFKGSRLEQMERALALFLGE